MPNLSFFRVLESHSHDGYTEAKRTVALHDLQELDDDLRRRADHDLAFAGLLGVVDVLESIVEDGSLDHLGGWWWEILKSLN
jgi:hypothetical protein